MVIWRAVKLLARCIDPFLRTRPRLKHDLPRKRHYSWLCAETQRIPGPTDRSKYCSYRLKASVSFSFLLGYRRVAPYGSADNR
jgi:hypothetical protein